MFDWEDQEIANIIWGEGDEGNIVMFPEESEKKCRKIDGDGEEREAGKSEACGQQFAATKTKQEGGKVQGDSLALLGSNSDVDCIGMKTDSEKGPEMSEDQKEETEIGDLTGSSWVNIESFDDLGHIFSNDDLVDHASLDNTEEFWASSRDVLDSAVKSSSLALDSTTWELEALGNSSGQFDFTYEYLHNESQSYGSGYEKDATSACYSEQMLHSGFDQEEVDITTDPKLILEKTSVSVTEKPISEPQIASTITSTNKASNKRNRSRSQSKHDLKSDKINNQRRPSDAYSAWPPPAINVQKFDTKSVPDPTKNYMPSVLGLQKIPQQPPCLAYPQFPNPYISTYSYGSLPDQCTDLPIVPATHDGCQPVLLSAESSLSGKVFTGKPTSTPIKAPNMTPQEKIEKLRRRQQMRALLAIKKQQQQLIHPVSVADFSIAEKSSQEDKILHAERTDFKGEECTIPMYDPNSPLRQDDSSSISVEVDDQNVEDNVLFQLQNTVTKLDLNIRLCIRDSLFRLAQSAMQRNDTGESSSANRSLGCESDAAKQDVSNTESFMRIQSEETETNSIDRAVAHLLFHRPFKSSVQTAKTPEASISNRVPLKLVIKSPEHAQHISTHGSTTPYPIKEPHQTNLSKQRDADVSINQKMNQKVAGSAD